MTVFYRQLGLYSVCWRTRSKAKINSGPKSKFAQLSSFSHYERKAEKTLFENSFMELPICTTHILLQLGMPPLRSILSSLIVNPHHSLTFRSRLLTKESLFFRQIFLSRVSFWRLLLLRLSLAAPLQRDLLLYPLAGADHLEN